MRPKILKSLDKLRHMLARQAHRWDLEVSSFPRRNTSAARDAQGMVVVAVLVVTELEVLLLKAAREVLEEEDTSTSVTRGTHQTMAVPHGLRTSLEVSRSTQSVTLWARTAAIKRAEHTDVSHERECESREVWKE